MSWITSFPIWCLSPQNPRPRDWRKATYRHVHAELCEWKLDHHGDLYTGVLRELLPLLQLIAFKIPAHFGIVSLAWKSSGSPCWIMWVEAGRSRWSLYGCRSEITANNHRMLAQCPLEADKLKISGSNRNWRNEFTFTEILEITDLSEMLPLALWNWFQPPGIQKWERVICVVLRH